MAKSILAGTQFDPTLITLIQKIKNEEAKIILSQAQAKELRDAVDETGSTLLHHAVLFNNVEIVLYLVNLGCKSDVFNNHGNTPLMLAFKNNQIMSMQSLLEGIDIIADGSHLKELLNTTLDCSSLACYSIDSIFKKIKLTDADEQTIVKLLLQAKCPLHHAVIFNRVGIVKIMIDNGCSVNNNNQYTGNSPLHEAVSFGNFDLVQLLIEHGANVNARNNLGRIPLDRDNPYVTSEDLKILQLLVDRGSLLTSCDNTGFMQVAGIFQHGNEKAINVILESKIDLNAQDANGDTVVFYSALNKRHILSLLIHQYDFNVNIIGNGGFTLLHCLSYSLELHLTKVLLEKGADVNVKTTNIDIGNVPPLHIAFMHFKKKCPNRLSDYALELIVEHEADVQYVSSKGRTILHQLDIDHICMSSIMLPYLALLEAQGTKLIEPLRQKIDSSDSIKWTIETHRSKIEQLKAVGIQESVTMFKLLTESEDRIIGYLRNKQLAEKLHYLLEYNTWFIPEIYVKILKKRVAKALNIIKCQEKAAFAFRKLVESHVRFDDLIVNEVIGFLSLKDLKNLALVECCVKNVRKLKRSGPAVRNIRKSKRRKF